MTEAAIALVRGIFEAWNHSGTAPPDDAVASDFELHSALSEERGEPYRGPAGLHEWLHDLGERLPGYTFEPDEIDVHGSRLLVLGTIQHEGFGTAPGYAAPGAMLVTVRDGRLARIDVFTDQESARAACDETPSGT